MFSNLVNYTCWIYKFTKLLNIAILHNRNYTQNLNKFLLYKFFFLKYSTETNAHL
jgi:hypothetical protein